MEQILFASADGDSVGHERYVMVPAVSVIFQCDRYDGRHGNLPTQLAHAPSAISFTYGESAASVLLPPMTKLSALTISLQIVAPPASALVSKSSALFSHYSASRLWTSFDLV